MNRRFFGLALFAFLLACSATPVRQAPVPAPARAQATPMPPVARRIPRTETIHGQTRVDDYAWLRNKGTPEVEDYLRAENAWTDHVMAPLAGLEDQLYEEMLARIKQTDLSVPWRKNDFFYYTRTEEGKQYPLYCRKQGSLDAPEQVLLDPNEMRKNEKFLAIGVTEMSDDGNLLAFSTDTTGFRLYTLQIKDLRTGELLPERIERTNGVAWAADNKTLFYVTEDDAKRPHRIWRHTLGADPAKDTLVYEEADERFNAGVQRSRSGAVVFIVLDSHTQSEVRWLRAAAPASELKIILTRAPDLEYDVEHRGDLFYLRINDRGRNFRLVSAPLADPDPKKWTEILAHRDDALIEGVDAFARHLVVLVRQGGLRHLRVFRPDEKRWDEIPMDEPVYALFPGPNAEFETDTYRYHFTSLVTPQSVYDWDLVRRTRQLLKRDEVLGGYDPTRYEQERVFAVAGDGARIPISLARREGVARDGKAPLLLKGYGSYGYATEPTFDANDVSLLDRGVVLAIAHIRGGDEMGKRWHDDGRMMKKRNTFTDFIACAEHLVREGYGARERLVIEGGSAGGLLMGAVVNLRPDLFKAVVAHVPFVDVINTMLDESLPLTVGEFEEWGNPRIEEHYRYMMSYSPYDNVEAKAYPAILARSAYNDSQVMYWEPAKWVAKLRVRKTDANPLLLRVDMDPAGHGGKSGRYERLREAAFVNSFILWQMGLASSRGR